MACEYFILFGQLWIIIPLYRGDNSQNRSVNFNIFFRSHGLFENLVKALDHLQGDKIGVKIYIQF